MEQRFSEFLSALKCSVTTVLKKEEKKKKNRLYL